LKNDEYLPIYSLAEWHYCPRSSFLSWVGAERRDEVTPAYQKMRQEHQCTSVQSSRTKKGIVIQTGVNLLNQKLKITGKADAVEWRKGQPFPVEYKNSPPTPPLHILVQVTLQALCLSEMYKQEVTSGFVFRLKEKRRTKVNINPNLINTAINGTVAFRTNMTQGLKGFKKIKQDGCHQCIYRTHCWPEKYHNAES